MNNCSENENPLRKLNFSVVFRPIYYFLRVFGFMPFTIVYDSKGAVQKHSITVFDVVWLLISLFVYLYAIHSTIIWYDSENSPDMSAFLLWVGKIFYILEIVFCIIGILMDLCNRYKLINILQSFEMFDEEVSLDFF